MAKSPPSEQAERTHEQDRHQEQVDQEAAHLGHEILAGDVADAKQGRRGEGAGDRTESADSDDDQHIDEIMEAEGWIETDDLDCKRAAESGKTAAERESHGENGINV